MPDRTSAAALQNFRASVEDLALCLQRDLCFFNPIKPSVSYLIHTFLRPLNDQT